MGLSNENVDKLCQTIAALVAEFSDKHSQKSTEVKAENESKLTEIEAAQCQKTLRRLTGLRLAANPYMASDELKLAITKCEADLMCKGVSTQSLPLQITRPDRYDPIPVTEELEIRAAELEGLKMIDWNNSSTSEIHMLRTMDRIKGLQLDLNSKK